MPKINNISKTIKIELRDIEVTRYRDDALYIGILYFNKERIGKVEIWANTKEEVIKNIIDNFDYDG